MSLGRYFSACIQWRNHQRVASATLDCPMIQASLTRRGHRYVIFQALKRLAKLMPPLRGVCPKLKRLAKFIPPLRGDKIHSSTPEQQNSLSHSRATNSL